MRWTNHGFQTTQAAADWHPHTNGEAAGQMESDLLPCLRLSISECKAVPEIILVWSSEVQLKYPLPPDSVPVVILPAP